MNNPIQVPTEKLKQQRQQVLMRHRKRKQRKKMMTATISSVIVLCLVFTLSIRVSPAFANYVAKIPGFAPIVELIEQDKGIRDVLKGGYFEEIGQSATSKEHHITLSVIGAIADNSGIAIAYTIEAPRALKQFGYPDIEITQNGKDIPAAFTYDYSSKDDTKYVEDVIMLTGEEGLDFKSLDFELAFTFDEIGETIRVPFTLTGEIHEPKTVANNIQLELMGQQLNVESVVVTPMRAIVKFDVDEANDMQIISVDGMKLVDERGEEWATIRNGLTAFGSLRDNNYTVFMESNYYREPKSLKLVIDTVAALPKGEDYIVVDFSKEEFVYAPHLPKFDMQLTKDKLSVKYKKNDGGLQAITFDDDLHSTNIIDSRYVHDDNYVTQVIEPTVPFLNPVRFNVDYYPNFIGENIEIDL